MYLTPAEPPLLFVCDKNPIVEFIIVYANPIVADMSQAKPRRQSNPKLVERFFRYTALQDTAPYKTVGVK